MKYITKLKLAAVHQLMDAQDKSTEFMIQYMQDSCNVDLDCVMNYLQLNTKTKLELMKEVNEFLNFFTIIDE